MLRGRHNIAGEFGHVPLSLDGPRCSCGANGCWEAYVSNRATLARYFGRAARDGPRPSRERHVHRRRPGRARAGAATSRRWRRSRRRRDTSAWASRRSINALDPARVYIGGEITAAWDLIEGTVRAALAERALTPAAAATDIRTVPQASIRGCRARPRSSSRPLCRAGGGLTHGRGAMPYAQGGESVPSSGRPVPAQITVEEVSWRTTPFRRSLVVFAAAVLAFTRRRRQPPHRTIAARVQGTVRDDSNAALPGATVTLTNDATGVVASRISDGDGRYLFDFVDPGIYTISADARGIQDGATTRTSECSNAAT